MPRETMADLQAFIAVARMRSFTRAAAQIGVSTSALSHAVRNLEERIGIRLLTRTPRSVATTEAGERLLQSIGPRFDEIEQELAALNALRDKPAGASSGYWRIGVRPFPATISIIRAAASNRRPSRCWRRRSVSGGRGGL